MIAVINYGAGNTFNVLYALQQLGVQPILTNNVAELRAADKIIFPGVGHATYAMQQLIAHNITTVLPTLTQPVLGICLGMQLLYTNTAESTLPTLNIIKGNVKKFETQLPVPHTGWNNIDNDAHILFEGITTQDFYFVHSYYAAINEYSIATCNYQINFCAAVQKNNFYGVQFHPEKSGDAGLQLLKNFINL